MQVAAPLLVARRIMGIRRWHGLPPPAKATREAPATIPAYWLGRLLAGPCLRSANIIRAGASLSTLLDKIVYKILYAKQWQNVYVAKCLYGNGLRVNCNERYATGQIHFFAAKRFGKRDASLVRLMTARRPVPRGRAHSRKLDSEEAHQESTRRSYRRTRPS